MELWVGIISEPSINGAVVGELGAAIIGTTFSNVRNGDKYWYEKAYPEEIVREIKRTSFGEIIRRNSEDGGRNIPDNVFRISSYQFSSIPNLRFPY